MGKCRPISIPMMQQSYDIGENLENGTQTECAVHTHQEYLDYYRGVWFPYERSKLSAGFLWKSVVCIEWGDRS